MACSSPTNQGPSPHAGNFCLLRPLLARDGGGARADKTARKFSYHFYVAFFFYSVFCLFSVNLRLFSRVLTKLIMNFCSIFQCFYGKQTIRTTYSDIFPDVTKLVILTQPCWTWLIFAFVDQFWKIFQPCDILRKIIWL